MDGTGIYAASPRHFSGQLTAKTADACAGLHRLEVHLHSADNGHQRVYIAYGRGAQAAATARAEFDRLTVGAWYHGSATLVRRTPGLIEWAGHVPPLQACQRRQRFSVDGGLAAAGATA